MSSYIKSTANAKTSSNKPFCKVCYDAGKSEREYTSHYVKNKPGNEGKVVCPYLLSLVCTYCKKKEGHTASHCPVLKQKNASQSSGARPNNTAAAINEDGWMQIGSKSKPASVSASVSASASASASASVEKHNTQPIRKNMDTRTMLSKMIALEESKELEKEVYREQYDANFPITVEQRNTTTKQVGGSTLTTSWSSIAKKTPVIAPLKPVVSFGRDYDDSVVFEVDLPPVVETSVGWQSWSGNWADDCP